MSGARLGWQAAAACVPYAEDFLYLPTTEQIGVCDRCPVRDACLDFAIATRATHIVYGGIQLPPRPIIRKD